MTDIGEIHADWLAVYVRKTRNFAPLVDWLRGDGRIDEPLRLVLADIAAGNLKPSKKVATRASATMPGLLRAEVDFWKQEFRLHAHIGGKASDAVQPSFPWDELERVLTLAGFEGVPETLGDCTKAAREVVGWLHRLTASQLDEILVNRAARPRKAY